MNLFYNFFFVIDDSESDTDTDSDESSEDISEDNLQNSFSHEDDAESGQSAGNTNSSTSSSDTETDEFEHIDNPQNASTRSKIEASEADEKTVNKKSRNRSAVSSVSNKSSTSLETENVNKESQNGSASPKSSSMSSESDGTDIETSSETSEESTSSEDEETSMYSDAYDVETVKIVVEKQKLKRHKIRKRFTLPFFFNYMAWILCVGTILISIFYLWAYGVMFGNDKTYQWLTSSIAYFWSDMLIIEPLKVILFIYKKFVVFSIIWFRSSVSNVINPIFPLCRLCL